MRERTAEAPLTRPVPSQPVLEVIHARRSVRAYAPQTIDRATVRTLLDAAVQAPTAMHMEPWAFVVVQDRSALKRYSDLAKALLLNDLRHRPPAEDAGGADHGHFLDMLKDPDFNIFYDAGTLIVVCGKPLGPYVTADCWLAAENLMLASCALGLGTCCIGLALPALNDAAVKSELGIPPQASAIAAIIVGVPLGVTPPVSREAPEILSWVGP